MEDRVPVEKTYNILERAALSCFLVLFLTSVGMIALNSIIASNNPNIDAADGAMFWKFTLTALISMMAGFLYGVNRTK